MIKKRYLQYLIVPSFAIMLTLSFFVGDIFAQTFENPIAYSTVNAVLGGVLDAVQGIVATLAVLMIVVGGILYMTSAGDQNRIDIAKKAVTAAVIGLALALAAPSFLREIYGVLGETSPVSGGKDISDIIFEILRVLIGFIGVLAVLMLVIGGIMYMTSGGDETRAETARNTIKYSIIGLIVAVISLVVVTQIIGIF